MTEYEVTIRLRTMNLTDALRVIDHASVIPNSRFIEAKASVVMD
jgi:hypothetical protein